MGDFIRSRPFGLMVIALFLAVFWASCFLGVRAGVLSYLDGRDYKRVCQSLIQDGYDVPLAHCVSLFRDS